jgi:hypothetical protein
LRGKQDERYTQARIDTRTHNPAIKSLEGGQPPKLYFGRQEKAIRAFLLARGKLLEDVVVTVAVWPYKKVYPNGDDAPCHSRPDDEE